MLTRRDAIRLVGALIGVAQLSGSYRDARATETSGLGTVAALNGESFVERQGQPRALRLNDAISMGDSIRIPMGSKLRLRMNDGALLAIASETQLKIDAYQSSVDDQHQRARISLVQGLLRAEMAPAHQPSIEVATSNGTVSFASADCFIEAKKDATLVGVLAGTATLTSAATHNSVTIPARWGARLEAGRDPVPARVWSSAEFDAVMARTNLS